MPLKPLCPLLPGFGVEFFYNSAQEGNAIEVVLAPDSPTARCSASARVISAARF